MPSIDRITRSQEFQLDHVRNGTGGDGLWPSWWRLPVGGVPETIRGLGGRALGASGNGAALRSAIPTMLENQQ